MKGTQEIFDALRHPLRRNLLQLAFKRPEITVRRASRDLREGMSNVRYHMHSLEQSGLVEQVDRKAEKGSFAALWSSTELGERALAILDAVEAANQ
jgi:DNA-binding transcriptional ArsR family regulator